jgi:hypothetical protein
MAVSGRGRERGLDVYSISAEQIHEQIRDCELSVSETVVDQSHRLNFESDDWLDSGRLLWRYFGQHRQCQQMDKNRDGAGLPKEISMWSPHSASAVVLQDADGRRVLCKAYRPANLPPELRISQDRNYIVSIYGNNVEFTHYLLTLAPRGDFTTEHIQQAFLALVDEECELVSGGLPDPSNTLAIESFVSAAGMERAAQNSLELLVKDATISISVDVRLDAVILCGWLGIFDGSIDEIFGLSPWAGNFILDAMLAYKPPISSSATILMDHSNAIESLAFQQARVQAPRQSLISEA